MHERARVTLQRIAMMALAISPLAAIYLTYESPEVREKESAKTLKAWIQSSQDHFVCAGIGHLASLTMIQDGSDVYFDDRSREPISVCGYGSAHAVQRKRDNSTQCPPLAWKAENCEAKYAAWSRAGNKP
jgi:hypothetical protein